MDNQEIKQKLLQTLDKVIQEGHWEGGLFTQNILKRLQALRQRVVDYMGNESISASESIETHIEIPEHKAGYRRLYVAVYQADGERLDRWFHLIKNLADFCASRPVYAVEAHVQELMRARRGRNYAYIVLWVKEADMLAPLGGQYPLDKFEHELYAMKPSGVKLENLIEFVHDGRRYVLKEGQLVAI